MLKKALRTCSGIGGRLRKPTIFCQLAMVSSDGGVDTAALLGSGPASTHSTDSTIGADHSDNNNHGDSAEEKRLKRMRRNRESAAQSRNRKKQYVEELEAQVRQLEDTVNALQGENFELRREHARVLRQDARQDARGDVCETVTG